MKNTKSTKRALLSAILALVMTVSMLVGTTFAWFTDSVTSSGNKIVAGNLDVELHMFNAASGAYENISDATKPIFGADGLVDTQEDVSTIWEPGKTQVVYLAIKNAGNLDLKYKVVLDVTDIEKKLNEVLSFTITPDTKAGDVTAWSGANASSVELGEQVVSAPNVALEADAIHYFALSVHMDELAGNEYMNGSITFDLSVLAAQLASEDDSFGSDFDKDATYTDINKDKVTDKDFEENDAVTIQAGGATVTLPEELGAGEYELVLDNHAVKTDEATNETTVSFDLTLSKDGVKFDEATPGVKFPVSINVGKYLNITSVTHKGAPVTAYSYDKETGILSFETDSFSPFAITYYEGSFSSDATAEDMNALISKGGEFTLTENLVLDATMVIAAGESVVLDLNGKTISGTMHKNVGSVIKNEGNLTINNGTVSSLGANGGSAILNKGNLIAKGVEFNGAPNADGSWPSYTINNTGVAQLDNCYITSYHGSVASYNEGALVTLNNSEINMVGIDGFTSHGIYTYNDGAVIVNGGKIANYNTTQTASGASAINGNVTVNSGEIIGRIENYYGTPVINGGIFTVKPNAKFIASGLYAADYEGGRYIIIPAGRTYVADGVTLSDDGSTYFISNEAGYAWVDAQSDAFFSGKTIKLEASIDFGGKTINQIVFWNPESKVVVDGQGFTLSNFVIKSSDTAGLFRGVFDAMNLVVDKANVTGNYVGVIAGNMYGNITNVTVKNSVINGTYWQTGALAGQYNAGNISGCVVEDCTINGLAAVGGLVGIINETTGVRVVENCTVKNTDIVMTGSFGGNYDNMFGIVTGCFNISNSILRINGCTFEGNTIKGVASDVACGVVSSSSKVIVDGVWAVADAAELLATMGKISDGDTILLTGNVEFDADNRTLNSGSWYDGLYYVGDKSFTLDLNGFTISQNGAVNDYLLNFKNDGAKANTITIKNGTLDAGTTAYCAICTSSTSKQQITINLEKVNLINNISNGSTAKIRGGAVLNVKDGTVITGKNSYLGIECVASTVNIYDGAEIYQNGTRSDIGGLVGACYGGTVNVYGGYGKSAKCGFIAMTSGGTINVYGGEWIANTDGTVGNNSNYNVLTSQNNYYETSTDTASIINVYGGDFSGGIDAWILNPGAFNEVAELNIEGGNFNANPTHYLVNGSVAVEADGIWTVSK